MGPCVNFHAILMSSFSDQNFARSNPVKQKIQKIEEDRIDIIQQLIEIHEKQHCKTLQSTAHIENNSIFVEKVAPAVDLSEPDSYVGTNAL